MKLKKVVTIGITTYNSNLFFFQTALDSAIKQSYTNLEIIIADDGSKNVKDIEKIITEHNDNRIIFLKNKKNLGVSASLNKIIDHAKGDYMCWCPDDDYMHKDKIRLSINELEINKKQFLFTDHAVFYKSKKKNITHNLFLKLFTPFQYILLFDRINGGSLMLPITFMKKNKFNENLRYVQDYDLWKKLFKNLDGHYLNKVLFYSRIHTNQTSQKFNTEAKSEITKHYQEYFRKYIFDLIYFNTIKIYFYIIILYKFRGLDKIINLLTGKDYQNFIKKIFFNNSVIFKIVTIFSINIGLILKYYSYIKNKFTKL